MHFENNCLKTYLESKKETFVIPRVAGIENLTAWFSSMNQPISEMLNHFMKKNAGILLGSVKEYELRYFAAFEHCDLFASWEPGSAYAKHIGASLPYVHARFPRPCLNAHVFDVFRALENPWTHGLRGKRLLIISSFAEMMKGQPQAYDVDLFPECTLDFLKPPLTQGDEPSRTWEEEFKDLCAEVDKRDFDVALCACGGYGNPLCAHIFSTGRSAIYVGGVLQLYFGIVGKRWLDQFPNEMRALAKPHWKRPTVKPKGFGAIESGCYW
jgi:hypothetical protein